TTPGDDPFGRLQVGPFATFLLQVHVAGVGGEFDVQCQGVDGRAVALFRRAVGGTADGTDKDVIAWRFDGGDGVAGINGPVECVRAMHGHDVGHHGRVQQGGHARHEVFAEGGVRTQDVAVVTGFGYCHDLRGGGGCQG